MNQGRYHHKPIPPAQRLIFALDVDSRSEALAWIDRLGDAVGFYKIGMELLTSGEYFQVLDELARRGKQVFVDLKFFDVPATVAATIKGLSRYPVTFATIHAQHDAMMRAAAERKGEIKLLAVTVLTSLDRSDLAALGIQRELPEFVVDRARAAFAAGCDGVIASGLEAAAIRHAVDPRLIVVCPGIRPTSTSDDQKRTVDVATAFANGADYIVVGRPIRAAAEPRAAAELIQGQIRQAIGAEVGT
jgi:orotidine-5'-phosphate decarboxylase